MDSANHFLDNVQECKLTAKQSGFSGRAFFSAAAILAISFVILIVVGNPCAPSTSPEKKTQVLLRNLQGMLNDYELHEQTTAIAGIYADLRNVEIMPHGRVTADETNPNRQLDSAMKRTGAVMLDICSLSGNKSILSKLPPEVFMKEPGTNKFRAGPIFLDGWGRPILFAPGRTSTASGADRWGASGLRFTNGEANRGISSFQPPNGRGLFISAGPDGDFSTGDDNLYSFEK